MSEAGASIARRALREHGLAGDPLAPAPGWSNELWFAPGHVVKVSSGRFRDALAHEARTLALLERAITCPAPIATGRVGRREWLLVTRLEGESLTARWATFDPGRRREAIAALAREVQAIHATPVPAGYGNPWLADAVAPGGDIGDAYHPPPHCVGRFTAALRARGEDAALLEAADRFVRRHLPSFERAARVLLHGDVHFGNLLWREDGLGWLDFETAQVATPELELESILRFCRRPQAFPGAAPGPDARSLTSVRDWLAEDYPALFGDPELDAKLEVHAVLRELLALLHGGDGGRAGPRMRLRALLQSRIDE